MNASAGKNSKLILAAMIFAVSMTFIDQTIVAISLPTVQEGVHLSTTGSQWVINGYLLSLSALFPFGGRPPSPPGSRWLITGSLLPLSALFAFGGRLADIAGHRRMVIVGVIVFAVCSALCGATPTGSGAEALLVF